MPVDTSQLPAGVPPLNSYYVYLTEGCNLACRHCWLSPTFLPSGGTGEYLDYKLFELAIEEGIPLGLSQIKLTGGEPLLHPDFIRIIGLLKKKGLGLTIETNGTLLSSSLARHLKDNSTLNFISLSLDGAKPETHDSFRGVKGSFENTCRGIRYLVEVGYRPQVIMSIHQGNVAEMEEVVRLATELGAGSVKFNIIVQSGRGEAMVERGQTLDIRSLIELGKQVEGEWQKRASIDLIYSWPMAFYSLRHLLTYQGYSCNIFSILGILPTGHLAMCGIGMYEPELVYGQLGQDNLFSLWTTHPILHNLRQCLIKDLEGICHVCLMREQCLATCVANNFHLYHRLTAAYWFCQEAEIAGLFPKSRQQSLISP